MRSLTLSFATFPPLSRLLARMLRANLGREETKPSRRVSFRVAMDDASIALYGYEPDRLNRISARLNLY